MDNVLIKMLGFFHNNSEIIVMFFSIVLAIGTSILIKVYWDRYVKKIRAEERKAYSLRLEKAIITKENENPPLITNKNTDKVSKSDSDNEEDSKNEDSNEINVLGLMKITLENINDVYIWGQKQVKASFTLAVSMCILGFILMIIAILLSITFNFEFQISLIPAIGGVITELVAGTALVVYRSSLAQLNRYHEVLHENERFLSSINLLGKFNTSKLQDNMLQEIIRSEIQMNILSIENKKPGEKKNNIKEKTDDDT